MILLGKNIGQILSNAESKRIYIALLHEIESVAKAKGLQLPQEMEHPIPLI